jgi:hypothetical protein
MAQLTTKEFEDLINVLADHMGLNGFYDKLLKANALVSRKRPSNVQALATQLYQLSAGLRRDHPSRYAVEVLWQEMLSTKVTEEHAKTIETLAERVNSYLSPRLEVIPEKSADLLAALGAYHQAIAALTNDEIAYTEMLLRATTDVARFLREHKAEIMAANSTTEGDEQQAQEAGNTQQEADNEEQKA